MWSRRGYSGYRTDGGTKPVEVIHHIQQAGMLSVGPTASVLEESDDLGVLLSVTDPLRGSVEHHFFPWTTIVQIIAPIG
jgi:hypothetical protein